MSEQPSLEQSGSAGGRRRATDASGRRAVSTSRKIDLLVVLGLLLPTVVAISVAVTGAEDDPQPGALAPTETALERASLVCAPSVTADGGRGASDVVALRVPDVPGGEVALLSGTPELAESGAVDLPDSTPVPADEPRGPVVLDGEGAAAPGMVGGRRDALIAQPCRAPSYDEWFLGLGASARRGSVITLVNPDATQAVVDITLLGPRGPVEEEDLRDVPVPGLGSVELDLAEIAPRRIDLAAHVSVTRGRISATVTHRNDPLGAGRVSVDTLPAQTEASTENLLLGVEPVGDARVLYLANPGDDEVRATVRVVNDEAVFTPTGTEDVVIAPRSMSRVSVASLVDAQAAEGMLGVDVESTGPVLATLRGLDEEDVVAVGAAERLDTPAAVVVPPGRGRLVLGGAQRSGVVRIDAYADDGTLVLDQERVEIGADRAVSVPLPRDVAAVTIEARNTPVYAAVLVESGGGPPGATVVPVRAPELTSRVPVVRPR